MNKTFLVIAVLFLFFGCAGRDYSHPVPRENIAILQSGIYLEYDSVWKPLDIQVDAAISCTINYLKAELAAGRDDPNHGVSNILKEITNYRFQVIPVVEDGKQFIYLNCSNKNMEFPDWRTQITFVFDGGYWFWMIKYDVEKDKCLDLRINGYA